MGHPVTGRRLEKFDQRPRFGDAIDGRGERGNIYVILSAMRRLARGLGLDAAEIDAQSERVLVAQTYAAKLAIVREWFTVRLDNDGR